ncbi:hypothetical protein [Microbacterium sp.]|uniref:hypothetical protein n=1 Tax=Microbacterium sp. TaxID=51671 RepID=UPI0039E3DB75
MTFPEGARHVPRHARPTTAFPAALREAGVTRLTDVTPGMRRITLAGKQLGAFAAAGGIPIAPFESHGFDDDLRRHLVEDRAVPKDDVDSTGDGL